MTRLPFIVIVLLTTAPAAAEGLIALAPPPPLPCPHEQITWQEVVTHRCRLVPETKQVKKTVYEVQEVPFCLKKLPPLFGHHQGCDDCTECACPRYKRVLLKKEIVCEEVCGTKCVIEEVIERVPCKVGVPCQSK